MVEVNIYSDIANKKEGIWMSMFGIEDAVFSADMAKNIFESNKKEKEFRFNLHCDGGSVTEGFAIYDIMRNSGKTIYTNVDGGCHSMAMCLLLAAPFENRTANRNSRALIHQVYAGTSGYMNAAELRDLADDVEAEQTAILDLYEDRTGTDREVLENLMKEEKQRTAKELLEYGFISKINNYNTNSKNVKEMSNGKKNPSLLNRAKNFVNRVKNSIGNIKNFDFTDEDDNVLFSTESEDDTLEIGMAASPDGEYTISDGTVVTITDGVISDIVVSDSGDEDVIEENKNLRKELSNALELITELSNQVQSDYTVNGRKKVPGKSNGRAAASKEEMKNTINESRKKWKGGK